MEGSDHSLVPQWLKGSGNDSRVAGINNQFTSSSYSDHITYSGRQWSSSSKGPGHSRSYSSSERSWQDTYWEKDIGSDGLNSASHDIPMTVSKAMMMHRYNVPTSTSSITLGTMGLSMAETLAQGPPRSHSPQLSASTQKLEALALKQSRLLIPVTPSTPRSLVSSSSEKSKVKTGQQQYSFSHSRRPNHSLHGAHPNLDIQKISSGNSLSVNTSREWNGVSSAAKDNLSPNSRVVLSPVSATRSTSLSAPSRNLGNNSTPSAWITLEKRPTFPIQSRNDFFKNLSRKSSLEKPCSDVLSIDMSCALENSEASMRNVSSCPILESRDASLVDTSGLNMLTDYGSTITENGNAANEPLKLSSSSEKQDSRNPFPYPDEEEIAFLRSLGWEESAGEYDEGLTEEEIQDFYEKYMKLKL
ncbi:uncharacterized protein LOC114421438 [Glycine soja]|uniref:Uncharacterized protein n=1 Tax=Glycine soja TaxID=3848 RepID=A0A445JBD6_GLYSO|nr:uncharacterized protein LOC114421438 [Glycine soja]RZB95796.1 hypothetical protein D0Y65_019909 [Glycine soja]